MRSIELYSKEGASALRTGDMDEFVRMCRNDGLAVVVSDVYNTVVNGLVARVTADYQNHPSRRK